MNELARKPAPEAWAPGTPRAAPTAPGVFNGLFLATRLAWRQLRADRARLMTAIAGVMFACVLVFMQLGFRGALFDSATNLLQAMRADLFIMHPMTQASFRPEPFPRARAWQTLADADVELAVPLYLAQATLRNPEGGSRRAVQVIGLDPTGHAVDFRGLAPLAAQLTRPDTFAWDTRSRPEFGPLGALFEARGPYGVQIGNREMELVGLVEIGPSFGADGNAVMSELNFRRIFSRQPAQTDLVALRLREGADVAAAQARVAALLPADVKVVTHAELVAAERLYWETGTPIGFIFVFGSVMGLVVGMVIVYQILFADIAGHLSEYATLKAMGYSNGFLARVVLGASVILAIIGFIPGCALSIFLYDFVAGATFLPLSMPVERAASVFLLIFAMCFSAGLLAMRKLRDANPADMF
jgi:putative ABC transport system permease protein